MNKSLVLLFSLSAFIVFGSGLAQADPATVEDITAQLRATVDDQKQTSAAVVAAEPQVEADIARTKVLRGDVSTKLDQDKIPLDAEAASLVPLCNITVPKEQLAAATQRCNEAKARYEADRGAYNTRVDDYNTELRAIHGRLQAAADRDAALKRDKARISQLKASLLATLMANCPKRCESMDGAAAAQCMSGCYDGAREQAARTLVPLGLQITRN